MMKERVFRFKRFAVRHERSAMKVGVDGVLVGAWCDVSGDREILDVGCGCGLISLMLAQRNQHARITGIEIDHDTAREATENVVDSPWADRVTIVEGDYSHWRERQSKPIIEGDYSQWVENQPKKFDHIVSNPPFFASGYDHVTTQREMARQAVTLSPISLLEISKPLLNPGGKISLIAPCEWKESLMNTGLHLHRICYVQGHPKAEVKRMLCEFGLEEKEIVEEHLVLHDPDHNPTEQYLALCRDFYLKF